MVKVRVATSSWINDRQVDLEGGEQSGRSTGKQMKVRVARRFIVENDGQDVKERGERLRTSKVKSSTCDKWGGRAGGNVT